MSGIQLSKELVDELKAVVEKHDNDAGDDLLFMQYLTAVTGFVLAHQNHPGFDQKGFLNDIGTFMGQVVDQINHDLNAQQPQEEAFGVWKPGD